MDPHQGYSAFVRAFEAGSFSAVAREMNTTQSAVSKQIAALEKSLKVQLFMRTTRRLQPTREALALYEHVRQLLDAVDAVRTSNDAEVRISGVLRISMPNAYGRQLICPLVPRFLRQFPEVQIDIVLTDKTVDLVGEGFELGIRVGELPATTLMARPIGNIDQRLVATPAYLSRFGTPEFPLELAEHRCILYGGGALWSRWEFESESGRHAVQVTGPAHVNDAESIYGFVRADQGIALVPDWVVQDDIEAGRVVWLLQDYYPLPQRVSIVYPQTRFLSRRARSFIDFVLDALQAGR